MATVPTPSTQTAGQVVPAATINSQGNLATYLAGRTESGGARRPVCVLRQTVAQAVATATAVTVTFDTEDVDYDNGHSTVTNTSRYTAGTAGWYHVDFLGAFAANVTGRRSVWLKVNSVDVNASQVEAQTVTAAGQPTLLGGSRLVFLNVNDFLETALFQDSGVSVNTVISGSVASMMCVEWRSV